MHQCNIMQSAYRNRNAQIKNCVYTQDKLVYPNRSIVFVGIVDVVGVSILFEKFICKTYNILWKEDDSDLCFFVFSILSFRKHLCMV
jgi:hypothetical protein